MSQPSLVRIANLIVELLDCERRCPRKVTVGGLHDCRCGRLSSLRAWLLACVWLPALVGVHAAELPDIRSVAADLTVPTLTDGPPAAGKRVKHFLPGFQSKAVYHVLYLPSDWKPGAKLPVLVEFAGNGGYTNRFGDISTGRPEGSNLGYGLSAGRGVLWLCLPYLNAAGSDLALTWWGDAANRDPQPTLQYCRDAVRQISRDFGGDESRLILCGFSRGAIACNFLGLHDDATARLWRGFFAYSHYDGVRQWPYPGSDRASALTRLHRLGTRPQFICGEGANAAETETYLKPLLPDATNLTFLSTGFRNHNDAWTLRPSSARDAARRWLHDVVASPAKTP